MPPSELFDIVNKKGMKDLFAISRFECTLVCENRNNRAVAPHKI